MNKYQLKIAGKELLKGNMGNAYKALTTSNISASSYSSGMWNFMQDGSPDVHFSFSGIDSVVFAYEKCAPLTSIINRKAIADSNGKIWIMNSSGKAKGKEATGDIATKVRALMDNPNPLQSGKQFAMMVKIYTELFGSCLIIPTGVPDGFPIHMAKHLWVVPRQMYRIDESNQMFLDTGKVISQITLTYKGISRPLNHNQCLLIKDITPSFCLDNAFLPETRLKPLSQDINNIIGALESSGVIIDRRGPSLVISSDASDASGNISLTDDEKKELQKDFASTYGLRRDQFRQIITNAAIKVQEVGFNIQELGLNETIKGACERICDAYVFPFELMANAKGTTFSNGYNADKVLYQNAIIPEAASIMEQFATWFELSKYGLTIEKDFSHVAALQGNKKEEADAAYSLSRGLEIDFRNDIIHKNQWREAKGYDPVPGDEVYYSSIKDSLGAPVSSGQNNQSNGSGQQASGN